MLGGVSRRPGKADHLGTYRDVDTALDPYPYNGATTTCEALWMGVPVVTLVGQRHISRVGLSLLSAVGLDALAAPDRGAYIRSAAALANDAPRLASLRDSLRERMKVSPLTDSGRLAAQLEAAYASMFARRP